MKFRREVLKARTIILLAGAIAVIAGSATGAAAADKNAAAADKNKKKMAVKAPPLKKAPPPEQGWYFHGGFDFGGRFYAERPGSGYGHNGDGHNSFLLPQQTESRAKYEEYGDIPPGLFLDWINLDFGSKDGRYRVNIWGDDVGYNAQRYTLDFSEAGKQYLTLGWDQTPHLWSYSAKTLFNGVGSTNLTVDNAIISYLYGQTTGTSGTIPLANRTNIYNYVNNNAHQIGELSVQRDTFWAGYRFTPTPNWDFNVSYSHEDRTGMRPSALNYGPGTSFPGNTINMPYPVDDTTQKPKASGEYDGVGAWGRYSVKFAYAGSIYTDNLTKLTAENPFGQTGGQIYPVFGITTLRVPLPPSNEAHAFTGSGAFDVPLFKSRFTTTDQVSRWTQNDPFLDTANNGIAGIDPLPVPSLNGEVVNFLTNNVLTSTLTSTLDNKIRVRYYHHDNRTAPIEFGTILLADSEPTTIDDPTEFTSFKKTNIDEDLTWKPARWFTLGGGYGFERWDRSDNRFVTRTNENIFRMFANTQVTDSSRWRISYSYGARRYKGEWEVDNWTNPRTFDLANRNQQKARTTLDIDLTDAISVTPNAGLRWTDYPTDTINQTGLHYDHSWYAGVDVSMAVSPSLRLIAGYTYANYKMNISAGVPNANAVCDPGGGTGIVPAICLWNDTLSQNYNTVLASASWMAIPATLEFRVKYAAAWSNETHGFTPCPLNNNNCNGGSTNPADVGLPWPTNKNLHQRFDATARYYFDKDTVRKLGWKGKVVAKLRYTWEKNHGYYWQNDNLEPYHACCDVNDPTGSARSLYLAYDNPNYTVQLIAASLMFKW